MRIVARSLLDVAFAEFRIAKSMTRLVFKHAAGSGTMYRSITTGVKTPLGIKIMGPDLDRLGELAEEIAGRVRTLDGTLSAYPEKTVGGNYFDFEIDRRAREHARRTAWVYADLAGVDIGTYVERARRLIGERIALPPGYSLIWSGQYEYMPAASARLRVLIPVTILAIFILLRLHFGNLVESSPAMLTLPFALVGGIWLLWLLDLIARSSAGGSYNLSVAVYAGLIALAGLAAETGIVMLVYIDGAYQRMCGEGLLNRTADVRRAVMDGAVQRVRPKVMTVATTALALRPIMWTTSTGAETMKRIAAPTIGGLISTTILTLAIVPVVYEIYLERRFSREREADRTPT